MWEQYKRTFLGMQLVIAGVTCTVAFVTRVPALAGVFFVTMETGAVLGAMWGTRLKNKIRRARELPEHRG